MWDTKPRRAPNPKDIEFQTAEVVIPNLQYANQLPLSNLPPNGELFPRDDQLALYGQEIDKQKMNRLIWGDNLLAMQALLAQGYEGKINLIYIDPPFDSKADYSHKMTIEGNEFTKEPSVIERLAYKDTWAGGTDSYLDMLYPRLQLMKRLLAKDGTEELVYVGYPDRPITAKKAEELAVQAQKLDGRGYKRLVILGWDYEYNYHQALESRKDALEDKLKVKIESRNIPPDIYDYLKKAKTEEDIEALADKVHFHERPYLRLSQLEIKPTSGGKIEVTIGIKRYVLMDIPISCSSKIG